MSLNEGSMYKGGAWLLVGLLIFVFLSNWRHTSDLNDLCDEYQHIDELFFVVPETMQILSVGEVSLDELVALYAGHDSAMIDDAKDTSKHGYFDWHTSFVRIRAVCSEYGRSEYPNDLF